MKVTDLLYGAKSDVLGVLFEHNTKIRTSSPVISYKLELRCPECGELFAITVSSLTSLRNLFSGTWITSYRFGQEELPLLRNPNEKGLQQYLYKQGVLEYQKNNVTLCVNIEGHPLCVHCDNIVRKKIIDEELEYQEQVKKQWKAQYQKRQKQIQLDTETAQGLVDRYFKPFDIAQDPVNDDVVASLKGAIKSLRCESNPFMDACNQLQSTGDTSTYYYKLMEYEYEKVKPVVCPITSQVLKCEKRYPFYFEGSSGKELFDTTTRVIFCSGDLLQRYSKVDIREKLQNIISSEEAKERSTDKILKSNQRMRFGKYKGHTISEISGYDPGYLDWLESKGFKIQI